MSKHMREAQAMKAANEELVKAERAAQAMKQQMVASENRLLAMLDYVEKEIKSLEAQPASEARDRKIYLNQLRREGAQCNLELVRAIGEINPTQGLQPAVLQQIDFLSDKSRYLVIDYQTVSYRLLIRTIEQVVGAAATGTTGPLKPSFGQGPAQTAAAGPRPGIGPRPGAAPRPAAGAPPRTGPIGGAPSAPRPTGTGPLGQAPARPTGSGPLRPGTGPLGAPRTGGTGPLGGQGRLGTGQLGEVPQLNAIKQAAQDQATRQLLTELVARYQDLEQLMASVQGEAPGQLAIGPAELSPKLKQIQAKVYYINRVLQQLGPLGNQIPFENWNTDPAALQLLNSVADTPAKAEASDAGGSLTGMLKSLFK